MLATYHLDPCHHFIVFIFLDSFSLAGAPLGVWRRMDQGVECPITQDNPERMGGSPDISCLPPLGKRGRLEVNGSTTESHVFHSESPQRPQGGKGIFERVANK